MRGCRTVLIEAGGRTYTLLDPRAFVVKQIGRATAGHVFQEDQHGKHH